MKVTIHLPVVPRLRISGAASPFRPTPLWLNKENFALGLSEVLQHGGTAARRFCSTEILSTEILQHGDLKYTQAET
jgi:hypothetical protein